MPVRGRRRARGGLVLRRTLRRQFEPPRVHVGRSGVTHGGSPEGFGHGRGGVHRLRRLPPLCGRGSRGGQPRQADLRRRLALGGGRRGHPGYRFVQADIADPAAVHSAFAEHRPDAVLHLAAESHVDRSITGPGEFVRTNVVGTLTLLQAALEHWRTLKGEAQRRFRFLHVSTDEVYGSLGADGLFSEATALFGFFLCEFAQRPSYDATTTRRWPRAKRN